MTTHHQMRCSTIFVVLSAFLTCTKLYAADAAKYRVVGLGTLGGEFSQANSVNNYGQVVGYSYLPGNSQYHAFLYDNSVMSDIGTLDGLGARSGNSFASDINDRGQIVGTSTFGSLVRRAFLYDGGTMVDLGDLSGGKNCSLLSSSAYSINNLGQIVGEANALTEDGECYVDHAFRYHNGLMVDLGSITTHSDGHYTSYAFGINDLGEVVGRSTFFPHRASELRAFVYRNGNMTGINTLGGHGNEAEAINAKGQIVGISQLSTTSRSPVHGYLLDNGNLTDLGTLEPVQNHSSIASDINNQGHVVGASDTSGNAHAVFFGEDKKLTDLNTLIGDNARWELLFANGINDHGQIVGRGFTNGQEHAYLLNPIVKGIDISRPDPVPTEEDFRIIKQQTDLRVVVVQASGGRTVNPLAQDLLGRARRAGFLTAAYCYLNFASSLDGSCQIREAVAICREEAEHLGFMAIDVETVDFDQLPPGLIPPRRDPEAQVNAVARIGEAVDEVQRIGLRPIIYTKKTDWDHITGLSEVAANLFGSIPIWHTQTFNTQTQLPTNDDLDEDTGGWPFAGWTRRAGKQYRIDTKLTGYNFKVDLNVFDLGVLSLKNDNYTSVSPCPYLTFLWFEGSLVLEWQDPTAILEEAPHVDGPWTPVDDLTMPYGVPPMGTQKFFRLRSGVF